MLMLYGFLFAFGAIIGSFLNVCIGRLPEGESIVSPASHCPRCGAAVQPRDNIPLLSYVLLRGRCRSCREAISLRYPLVEALMGALLVLVFLRFGSLPLTAVYGAFVAALLVVTFIDLDHMIIPDVISLPGIAVGLACAVAGYGPTVWESVIGILLGGGLLYLVAVGYEMTTGREGMGGGDIKLLAMVGAFLGWRGVLVTVLIGSLTGALIGIGVTVYRRQTRVPIPFGPFLSLGALCALFVGEQIVGWYLRRSGLGEMLQ
jgi:leader peptidase (prepilin peptidase)/N-methyltransferase